MVQAGPLYQNQKVKEARAAVDAVGADIIEDVPHVHTALCTGGHSAPPGTAVLRGVARKVVLAVYVHFFE